MSTRRACASRIFFFFFFFFVFVVLFCFVFSFLSFHIVGAVLLNPRNHKVYTRQVFSHDYLHEMTGLEDIRQKVTIISGK